jgi:hypothetical protein
MSQTYGPPPIFLTGFGQIRKLTLKRTGGTCPPQSSQWRRHWFITISIQHFQEAHRTQVLHGEILVLFQMENMRKYILMRLELFSSQKPSTPKNSGLIKAI